MRYRNPRLTLTLTLTLTLMYVRCPQTPHRCCAEHDSEVVRLSSRPADEPALRLRSSASIDCLHCCDYGLYRVNTCTGYSFLHGFNAKTRKYSEIIHQSHKHECCMQLHYNTGHRRQTLNSIKQQKLSAGDWHKMLTPLLLPRGHPSASPSRARNVVALSQGQHVPTPSAATV